MTQPRACAPADSTAEAYAQYRLLFPQIGQHPPPALPSHAETLLALADAMAANSAMPTSLRNPGRAGWLSWLNYRVRLLILHTLRPIFSIAFAHQIRMNELVTQLTYELAHIHREDPPLPFGPQGSTPSRSR